jgi:hypothetical protein
MNKFLIGQGRLTELLFESLVLFSSQTYSYLGEGECHVPTMSHVVCANYSWPHPIVPSSIYRADSSHRNQVVLYQKALLHKKAKSHHGEHPRN